MSRKSEATGVIPTIAGLARVCGVARSTVQQWMRDSKFPPELATGGYDLFAVGEWKGARDEATRQKQLLKGLEEDPLLVGEAASPQLERYRGAKASLAELDLAERERSLVPLESISSGMHEICLSLRGGLEELQRQHGTAAHKLMDDKLRDAESRIDELFGPDCRDGEEDSVV